MLRTLCFVSLLAPALAAQALPTGEAVMDRFAQAIGATLSLTAAVLHFGFGATTAALVLVAMITVAASLEAFAGYCLGCAIFGYLMRVGVIPEETCEACNNLNLRRDPVPA